MATAADLIAFLERLAPTCLAESWDNVGLLLGDAEAQVQRAMTCLTLTDQVVDEVVAEGIQFVATHHPLPFRPLKRIVAHDPTGRRIWRLAGAGCAVYSAHTAFDSAVAGINAQIAERLQLVDVRPLALPPAAAPEEAALGTGRRGDLATPCTLDELAAAAASALGASSVQVSAAESKPLRRVGICCGSGAELLDAAEEAGCDVFLTGEASFHACLEAEARGMAMVLLGHYVSERFAMESLAEHINRQFSDVHCTASRRESNPLRSVDCR